SKSNKFTILLMSDGLDFKRALNLSIFINIDKFPYTTIRQIIFGSMSRIRTQKKENSTALRLLA
ncbi:hypothetical protein EF802_07870, partial [Staphylococcus pseudintermedius]|nr:hypothetical protein [Staphylococcus pseudintermedius]